VVAAGIAGIAVIGVGDWATGYEWGFSLMYLAPIAMVAWRAGRAAGLAAAVAGAVSWTVADIATGHPHSMAVIPFWNGTVRLGTFAVVASTLAALRAALAREQALARTDVLTAVANARSFRERAQLEIDRANRTGSPLALAYLDVDGFKGINDTLGHAAGDALLQAIAARVRQSVRATDYVARLGGDEFAILMADADEGAACEVVERLVAQLGSAAPAGAPLSISVGIAAFATPPQSIDAMIRRADDLMYEAKREGRSCVRHATVGAP
jgi:diguanylate cyclase (GGDEF)-like protein